jgi:hypothetical protein
MTVTTTGSSIVGTYIAHEIDASTVTESDRETNQSETDFSRDTESDSDTEDSSGNSLTGAYTTTETDISSGSATQNDTDQTDGDTATTTDSDSMTVTTTGSSILGTYVSLETDASTTTETDQDVNQSQTDLSTDSAIDSSTVNSSGNSITGAITTTETDVSSDTATAADSDQTEADTTTTTDSDTMTVTTTNNSILGTFNSYETDSSSATVTDSESDDVDSDNSTDFSSGSDAITSFGNSITGLLTTTESGSSVETVTASGYDQRGDFTSTETTTQTDFTTDAGNEDTGADGPATTTTVVTTGAKFSVAADYTEAYTDASTTTEQDNGDSVTGSYTTTSTSTDDYTLTETGVDYNSGDHIDAANTYTIYETDSSASTATTTADSFSGADTATTSVTSTSSIEEFGTNDDGNYDLEKTSSSSQLEKTTSDDDTGSYTTSAISTSSSTANEGSGHDYWLSGYAGYTETVDETVTTSETGNNITGVYTRTILADHSNTDDNDVGVVQDYESFSITESSSVSQSGTQTGNSITSDFTLSETGSSIYSMGEVAVTGYYPYTLTETGSMTLTTQDTGNSLEGFYENSVTGTDHYTLRETGTFYYSPSATYSESVVGTDTYTLVENGNPATQTYDRSITGGGTYTINGSGPGSYSLDFEESVDALAGESNISIPPETTVGRYALLEEFVDASNNGYYSQNDPGNMNFSPVGQPWVDPSDPPAIPSDLAEAANRLGINLSTIRIENGVARFNVEFANDLLHSDMRTVAAYLRSQGANSVVIQAMAQNERVSRYVANPRALRLLMGNSSARATTLGEVTIGNVTERLVEITASLEGPTPASAIRGPLVQVIWFALFAELQELGLQMGRETDFANIDPRLFHMGYVNNSMRTSSGEWDMNVVRNTPMPYTQAVLPNELELYLRQSLVLGPDDLPDLAARCDLADLLNRLTRQLTAQPDPRLLAETARLAHYLTLLQDYPYIQRTFVARFRSRFREAFYGATVPPVSGELLDPTLFEDWGNYRPIISH